VDPNVLAVIVALLINALTAILNVGKSTAKLESVAQIIVELKRELEKLRETVEELSNEVTRLKTIEETRSAQYVRANPQAHP
jgi:cell division protein FtsB